MDDSRILDTIVAAGVNDAHHFVSGWHERACDGRAPVPYRACGARGTISVRRAPAARRMHVLLSAPVGVAGRGFTGTISIDGGKRPLEVGVDAWVLRSFDLPPGEAGTLDVTFSCDDPIVPDEFLHNGDGRLIGWYISAVWQD